MRPTLSPLPPACSSALLSPNTVAMVVPLAAATSLISSANAAVAAPTAIRVAARPCAVDLALLNTF